MELSIYIAGPTQHQSMKKVEQALDSNATVGAYYSERKELIAEYGGMPPAFFFEQNKDIIQSVREKELTVADVVVVVGMGQGITEEINQAIDDGIPLVLVSDTLDEVNTEVLPYVRYVLADVSDLAELDFETC